MTAATAQVSQPRDFKLIVEKDVQILGDGQSGLVVPARLRVRAGRCARFGQIAR